MTKLECAAQRLTERLLTAHYAAHVCSLMLKVLMLLMLMLLMLMMLMLTMLLMLLLMLMPLLR